MSASQKHAVFIYYSLLLQRNGVANCFGTVICGELVAELLPSNSIMVGMVYLREDKPVYQFFPPPLNKDQVTALDIARQYAEAVLLEDLETEKRLAPVLLPPVTGVGSTYDLDTLVIMK